MRGVTTLLTLVALGAVIGCMSMSPTVLSTATPPKSEAALPSGCPHEPLGGFGRLWQRLDVGARLGCAHAPSVAVGGTLADLLCAHTVWLEDRRQFIVAEGGHGGWQTAPAVPYLLHTCDDCRWSFIADGSGLPADAPLMTWPTPEVTPIRGPPSVTVAPPPGTPAPTPAAPGVTPGLPATETPMPSMPKLAPLTGAACAPISIGPISASNPYFVASGRHGWLACSAGYADRCRGLARSAETQFEDGALQKFEGGWLFWDGVNAMVLFDDGTWLGW
jgi:hypothetical protein